MQAAEPRAECPRLWRELEARLPADRATKILLGLFLAIATVFAIFVLVVEPNTLALLDVSSSSSPFLDATAERARFGLATQTARLGVATVLRDFSDEAEASLETLRDKYANKRTLLMRMQLLHISALSRQVDEANRASGKRFAELVVVTSPAGLERREVRSMLRKGARVVVADGGYEMRALWSLDSYERVLYVRPGMRFREGVSLGALWKRLGSSECIMRAHSPAAADFHEARGPGDNRRRLTKTSGLAADLVSAPPGGRQGRRNLELPPAKITPLNPAIDISKLTKLNVSLVEWETDPRMRPVLALWFRPESSLYNADAAQFKDEARFRPVSLDECTLGIMAGFAGSTSECRLASLLEQVPADEILWGSAMAGEYPLPVQYAWKKDQVLKASGALVSWLYDMLETSDAKACAKAFQVERMAKVAKAQIMGIRPRPPRTGPRRGRFAHQAMVMKSHLFTERVNQTLHAWARHLYAEGGEVIAAFQGKHSPEMYAAIKDEQHRAADIGFELLRLDNDEIVRHVIPFEAPVGFAQSCKLYFYNTLLCNKRPPNETMTFARDNHSVNRLMWFHTFASTMVIFKHMLDSRPDLEYLWVFDYDVTFTGKLSTLFDRVGHDDSDLLAVSWQFASSPEAVLKKEAATENVNMWKGIARYWQPRLRLGRVNAGAIRVSRRMIQWCLEAAFTPLNWSIDEIFFFDTCERNKPRCKYSPFQLFGLVDGSTTFYNYDSRGFAESLHANNGNPTNKLRHAVKNPNISVALEPWLVV